MARTFELKIYMDSDSFQHGYMQHEIAELLEIASCKVMNGEDSGACIDTNGNTVGAWSIEE